MKKISYSTLLFSLFTSLVLIFSWLERDEYWYNAEDGLGYAFGIIGGSMMLLLLLYPARKYWKPMRNAFKVHHWFRLHMVFGVWGPVFILLHSNFNLGSLNSNIALFSMLLVAGSGLIGRYVYQKLHRGLYGEQIAFSDLNDDYQQSKSHFSHIPFFTSEVQQLLIEIEEKLSKRKVPLSVCLWGRRQISHIQQQSNKSLKKLVKQQLLKNNALTEAQYQSSDTQNSGLFKHIEYWHSGLFKLKKMASYALYTRLFSLWHVFHLPIFFMMIIAAVVHIFVVHMY